MEIQQPDIMTSPINAPSYFLDLRLKYLKDPEKRAPARSCQLYSNLISSIILLLYKMIKTLNLQQGKVKSNIKPK